MPEHLVELKYGGLWRQEGMDAILAAEAIKAFADLIRRVHAETFGHHPPDLRLGEVKRSSQLIQILMDVPEAFGTLAGLSGDIKTFCQMLNEVLNILKHLKGHSPKSRVPDGQGSVQIENNNGEVHIFNIQAENIALRLGGGKNAEKFVRRPLAREAKKLELFVDGKSQRTIVRDDANDYLHVQTEDNVFETETEIWLTIIAPVLEGSAQWRFSDGSKTFAAPVNDEDFLEAVDKGQRRFGKGDNLLVVLRAKQERAPGGKLKAKLSVEKVIEHIECPGGERSLFAP